MNAINPAFLPDGTVLDLRHVRAGDISFADMANALSKIARFNGIYRCPAYSVAQHSVMGADALFAETGDAALAGYFVLHDGHEYLTGDITRPMADFIGHFLPAGVLKPALDAAKAVLDAAIYAAAGLPDLANMPAYRRQVKDMDERMLRAEGLALFGPQAGKHLPAADRPAPRLTGAIRPWAPMKAEEAFVERLGKYLGIDARPF